MKVISKEIQYSETGKGNMYCIQHEELYIFTLSNFSWSVSAENEKQLEDFMKYENHFQGFKDQVIDAMKEMMKEI